MDGIKQARLNSSAYAGNNPVRYDELKLYYGFDADEARVIRLTYRILFFTMPRHDRQLSG
jgi:hypothetical protein